MATDQIQRERNAVALPANSFDLAELEKALDHAVSLKTDEGRDKAIDKAIIAAAAEPDVITGPREPFVPTGTEYKEITGQVGDAVKVPVSIAAEEAVSYPSGGRNHDTRATTPTPTPTPTPPAPTSGTKASNEGTAQNASGKDA